MQLSEQDKVFLKEFAKSESWTRLNQLIKLLLDQFTSECLRGDRDPRFKDGFWQGAHFGLSQLEVSLEQLKRETSSKDVSGGLSEMGLRARG